MVTAANTIDSVHNMPNVSLPVPVAKQCLAAYRGCKLVLMCSGSLAAIHQHRGVLRPQCNPLFGRVDLQKVVFVHPQLPGDTCTTLGIPALEERVTEVLDAAQPMHSVLSIQARPGPRSYGLYGLHGSCIFATNHLSGAVC